MIKDKNMGKNFIQKENRFKLLYFQEKLKIAKINEVIKEFNFTKA